MVPGESVHLCWFLVFVWYFMLCAVCLGVFGVQCNKYIKRDTQHAVRSV